MHVYNTNVAAYHDNSLLRRPRKVDRLLTTHTQQQGAKQGEHTGQNHRQQELPVQTHGLALPAVSRRLFLHARLVHHVEARRHANHAQFAQHGEGQRRDEEQGADHRSKYVGPSESASSRSGALVARCDENVAVGGLRRAGQLATIRRAISGL